MAVQLRSDWAVGREGVTLDTLLNLSARTLLSPRFSLPLYLWASYTARGKSFIASRPRLQTWMRRFLYVGLLLRAKKFLDEGVSNHWTNDVWDWRKEVVVVTGGSDGIGALVVRGLAERRVRVVVLDVQKLTYDAPPNVYYFYCDLASVNSIRAAAADIRRFVGNPTVLINNAGIARGKSILDATDDDLRLTFQVNALSHYHLAQEFLPHMIKHNHGMVVTVASLAAYVSAPRMVDYCASKSAALTFHEGLTAELTTVYNANKVRTVVVCQGYTRTELFQGFHKGDTFISYPLHPVTVAESVIKAVLRGRSDHISLPKANSFVYALRAMPTWIQIRFREDMKKMMKNWAGRQVAQPSEDKAGPANKAEDNSSVTSSIMDVEFPLPTANVAKANALKTTGGSAAPAESPERKILRAKNATEGKTSAVMPSLPETTDLAASGVVVEKPAEFETSTSKPN